MSGSLPSEVGLLTALTELVWRSYGHLAGPIPTEVGLLTALMTLDVFGVYGGTVPTEIGLLGELNVLELVLNELPVGSTLPTELNLLTKLVELTIKPQATGEREGALPSIHNLTLGRLTVGGAARIPTEVGQMTTLTSLELSNTEGPACIPTEIGNLNATLEWLCARALCRTRTAARASCPECARRPRRSRPVSPPSWSRPARQCHQERGICRHSGSRPAYGDLQA